MAMRTVQDRIAIITGASRGIGKAIALRLAREGATLCLVGRDRKALGETANAAGRYGVKAITYELDLLDDHGIARFAGYVQTGLGGVDILIHSAGLYGSGELASTSVEDLDLLYKTNVRAPLLLTQSLLEIIKKTTGQIVFINSTLGLQTRVTVGQFASTQHALKAMTDTLREELNPYGVRVLNIFAGRTATPRMAEIFRMEARTYCPELLVQPEDIAAVVTHTVQLPNTAEVTNISIRPLQKSY
jgi:NADP-dependent 3-hydroxy acid dehydrogenase YdfG